MLSLSHVRVTILFSSSIFSTKFSITSSSMFSNFGNILAVVIASVLLPFFPMTSIQLLLLNLLYDVLR